MHTKALGEFIGEVARTTLVHLTASVSARFVERSAEVVQEKWLGRKKPKAAEAMEEMKETKSSKDKDL